MWAFAHPRARVRPWAVDRVSVALVAVFVPAAAFYVWTAATSVPLSLHAGETDRYNLLATAFLHLRLWIANAPAGLLHLAEPYNPAQNAPFVDVGGATNLHDDVLYGSHLYFAWGPAPALVLLVPLHVLGWEPSASVTVAFFGVAGLGFALAALRVVLRQLADTPLWICVLAACAVALGTTVPFLLRTPSVTEDTIAGGFCFTMAGVWLVASTVVDHRASLWRAAAASLSFGLAAGSRPELGLAAVALVPVYFTLRATHPRRPLLLALGVPVGVCFALLAAYNQARFGNPLEIGLRHQLAGYDQLHEPLGNFSYLAPGAWLYTLSPPRPTATFPFLVLGPPPLSYPAGLPATYAQELTGGLLATTPVVLFLVALPWIWRRRPAWLGALAGPLVSLAGAGVVFLLFLAFENRATTERYEVDFAGLVLLGALAAWLALASHTRGALRRVVRVGGGLLVVWGCVTGFAVSFIGYGDFLAVEHRGEWNTLQDAGSPLTALIARIAGRPVVAEVPHAVRRGIHAGELHQSQHPRGGIVLPEGRRTGDPRGRLPRHPHRRTGAGHETGPGNTTRDRTGGRRGGRDPPKRRPRTGHLHSATRRGQSAHRPPALPGGQPFRTASGAQHVHVAEPEQPDDDHAAARTQAGA